MSSVSTIDDLACDPDLQTDDYLATKSHAVNPASAIYYPFVVWVIGVFLFFLLKRFRFLSAIPYAAAMFLLGTFMGMGAEFNAASDDLLTVSIHQWVRIDGNLLLLVFLPGLIFRDAIEVDLNLFVYSFSQLLILAFPMVLVGTGLVAVVCVYTLPSSYNFSWSLGATLGSILSSTDPVAVAAVLSEAGAPPRLKMHIAGESMLNDGAALVFYSLFSQIYLSPLLGEEPIGWGEGIKLFFQASLGGVAMGIAFALGLVALLYELDRRLDPEYNSLQVVGAVSVAYISYFAADMVQMSGVLSCLFCGIGGAWLGKGLINDIEMMDSYLKLMEHMLNSLLFALGGSIWGSILFSQKTTKIGSTDWGHLVAFYLLVLLIRFFIVGLFYPILSRIGLKSNLKEASFLAFGGLRGAVGIALAASLFRSVVTQDCSPDSRFEQDATRLVFLSGGISLGTLLLNGTAAGWVIKKLDLALPDTGKTMQDVFEKRERDFVGQEYEKLMRQARFSEVVDFDIVKAHVPKLTRQSTAGSTSNVAAMSSSILEPRGSGTARHHQTSIALIALGADTPMDEKVVQLRLVFLDMLKETYEHAVDRGELVQEGGNRALDVSAFRHSVDFAEADAKRHEMNDWEALQMFSTVHDDAKTFIQQRILRESFGAYFGGSVTAGNGQQERHKHNHIEYKKKRARLLRAFCFIEAHKRVHRRLEVYVDAVIDETSSREDEDERVDNEALQRALQTVLDESSAEVEKAASVVEEVTDDQRQIILSHYVATIILNRLINMIEESAKDGLLHYDEARSYISKIESDCLPNHHIHGHVCECLVEHSKRKHEQTQSQPDVDTKEA
ncbi:hydrogen exchanger 7 [Seminavis robusta]|uniref:Hydrogen exchanger 7 n=1 Tax=Seminavis robusta TaxID=568900 RepID=A0A9N8E6K6_9STRA|nr:hydrogen exchanger 7 [Seminavis robusta]|eukprot:Sro604_g174060.1 hydrogen exchanger 7 (839) ;mRNA; f:781-3481